MKKNDKEKAAELLRELRKTGENKKETDRFGKYLMRNWDSIRARQEEQVPGSCTEGQVSHVLSERFSRNPMGWSCKMIRKLSVIRIYEKNGGKVSGKDLRGEKEEKEAGQLCQEKIPQELDTAHYQ